MFTKLKKETFYIKETIRYGYGPISLLNYFKNRIFARQILKSIPKNKYENRDNFEIHMLCQKSDVVPAVWSLWSFLSHSRLCPKIIIHDDGSLDRDSESIFKSKFDNLEIIWRKDTDKLIDKADIDSIIKNYRRAGHPLILKLIDIFLLSRSEKVMVLDSDVLFFKKPEEIIRFVNGATDKDACISKMDGKFEIKVNSDYLEKHELIERKIEFMNSGIIIYNKSSVSKDKLGEYLKNCKMNISDYFVEMTGWDCLIGQTNYEFLPADRYILKGKPDSYTIAKHFTNPRRHEFYIYGIDSVKANMKFYEPRIHPHTIILNEEEYYSRAEFKRKQGGDGGPRRKTVEFLNKNLKKPAEVLEIGCGITNIPPFLSPDISYFGIDPSEFAIEKLRELDPSLKLVTGYAEKLPFEDGKFDAAFSFQVLEHVFDPNRALLEMVRVLKPKGYIIVLAPNPEAPWAKIHAIRHYPRFLKTVFILKRWADLFLRMFCVLRFRPIENNYTKSTGRYDRVDDDLMSVTSTYEVVALLKRAGLNEIMVSRFEPKSNSFKNKLRKALTFIPALKYYGTGIFVIFQKPEKL